MKKLMLSILSIVTMSTGCADTRDPLTVYLDEYHYFALNPVTTNQHPGDIYPEPDLSTAPIIFLTDALTKDEVDNIMRNAERKSTLIAVFGSRFYDVSADADIIGCTDIELKTRNITYFRVSAKGAKEYTLSQAKFREIVDDHYRKIMPNVSLDGKYYIYGLLQVSSLEYEFLDDKGTKVKLETGSELEEILKAKLGLGWVINKNRNLTFIEPRFIGFRANKIRETIKPDGTRVIEIYRVPSP